jgi:hypothetical protein
VAMPAGDCDHIGCFTNEAVKKVNLLGEHEGESSQKITELEALCKTLREDAQKLREEKTTLDGMIQSHDELIMEMAKEYGLNRIGENDDDEDEDDDDEGNAIAPLHLHLLPCLRRSSKKKPPVENGPQEPDDLDNLDDLDDDPNEGRSDMDEWFPQDGCNDRD